MPIMTTQSPPTVEPAEPLATPWPDAKPAPMADARVDRAAAAIGPLLKAMGDQRDFAVRFWDGRGFRAPHGMDPRFTLVIRRQGALGRMLLPPTDLAIGEAFVHGDFDIEADIFAFVSLPDRLGGLAAWRARLGETRLAPPGLDRCAARAWSSPCGRAQR